MPSEETNLINDFSIVFKERKQKRCKTRRKKKPSKEALYRKYFCSWAIVAEFDQK